MVRCGDIPHGLETDIHGFMANGVQHHEGGIAVATAFRAFHVLANAHRLIAAETMRYVGAVHFVELAGSEPDQLVLLSHSVPDPGQWQLEDLCDIGDDGSLPTLIDLLWDCGEAAYQVSEESGATYFTHSGETGQSLGA